MLEDTIKKINICFVTDDNYVQHTGVAITSILQNAGKDEYFDFYIFDNGIKEINKDKLNTFNSSKVSIKYVDLSDVQYKFLELKQTIPHISKTSYFKFVIADLLPNIDKIIYLDGDLVVKQSLWELYNINLENYPICAVEDIGYTYWCNHNEELKLKFKCINSGVMLINCDLWRRENLSQSLVECAKDHDKVGFGQDQPVFNYVLKDRIKFISYKWNVQNSFYRDGQEIASNPNCEEIIDAANKPAIIHYTYIQKPWDYLSKKKAYEYWNYYKISPFFEKNVYKKFEFIVKDKLQINLITYNRIDRLARTLECIFDENSPIKDFDITILDNASTDGSSELIDEYCTKYKNLKHIRHTRNIGGNANICRSFELAQKEYLWTLCDDDELDFSNWAEIDSAIKTDEFDMIFTINNFGLKNIENTIPVLLFYAAFLPAVIYHTSHIDSTCMSNMYGTINTGYPHGVPAINIMVNKKGRYFVPKKNVVNRVVEDNINGKIFQRGNIITDVHPDLQRIYWHVGYMRALKLVKDKKTRDDLMLNVCFNHGVKQTKIQYLNYVFNHNALYKKNNIDNYWDIFSCMSLKYKIYFIYYFFIGRYLPFKRMWTKIRCLNAVIKMKYSV